MNKFEQIGSLNIDGFVGYLARKIFTSAVVDDQKTCSIIAEMFAAIREVLDPHTAVGVFTVRIC